SLGPRGFPNGVLFKGENGEIFCDRGKVTPENLRGYKPGPQEVDVNRRRGHFEDWIECIQTRSKPICDVEIGHRSATVCHLGNIAQWTNRAFKWDPQAEQIVGDEAASRWLSRPYRAPWQL
ncbi:MAG TPA: hypothetical protein VGB77_18760, partial [Abditibacteriaceae bacterium]